MKNYFEAGNGLIRGVVQEPDNFQVLDAVHGVGQCVGTIGMQMQEGMNEVIKKVDAVTRKKKKSCLSRQIAIRQDGMIVLVSCYDDDTQAVIPFILNHLGNGGIYRICLREKVTGSFFGISLSTGQCWIIGRREKVKRSYLYESFIKAGVIFNSQIPRSTVAEMLFEFFAPEIERTENVLTIPANAGWFEGKFYHAENFPLKKVREFASLPVLKRTLSTAKFFENWWMYYFTEIKHFMRWEDRTVIMMFPFMSILKSIMHEENCKIFISLNFVKVQEFPTEKLCDWFQIYNRNTLAPVSLLFTEKRWIEYLSTFKDEVVIVDFSAINNEAPYEKRKLQQRWQKTVDIFNGKIRLPDGNVSEAALATISTELKLQEGVYNIVLDEELYHDDAVSDLLMERNIMGILINEFIMYIEREMESIRSQIRSMGKKSGYEKMQIVWEIIKDFWEQKGIQVEQEAKIPVNIDFETIVEENCVKAADWIKTFVQIVRKEAAKYYFIPKGQGSFTKSRILYDEDYLWILPTDLINILKKGGLDSYRTRILLELKEKGDLETEAGRLTKKIQIGNVRQSAYQIKKELFNQLGRADIVELGKEDRKICMM